MKSKKKFIFFSCFIFLCLISAILFSVFNKNENEFSLTKEEKNWINGNKNQLIDISILNKIPVINYSGEGIFFDFITYIEEETGLEFNKIPYISTLENSSYTLATSNDILENQLMIYQDNYVILSLDNKKYNDLSEIKDLKIGVLIEDINYVKEYLNNNSITYKETETITELLSLVSSDSENAQTTDLIDAIILPKVTYLNTILEKKFTISYNISEYKINYVLSLGDNEILNSIIKKYYNYWYANLYKDSYYKHLLDSYFTFTNDSQAELASKRYNYGFIDNIPYDKLSEENHIGVNSSLINGFEEFAKIEMIYKNFSSVDSLLEEVNKSTIDLFFDNISNQNDNVVVDDGSYIYDSKTVVLSHLENKNIFNSIKSLNGQNVLCIKNTKLEEYLTSDNYNLITYDTIKKLIKDLRKDDVIVIDYQTYLNNFNSFKQFKIDFTFDLENKYGFKLNSTNKVFNNLFNFYINYYPTKKFLSAGQLEIYNDKGVFEISKELLISIVIIITLLIIIILLKIKPKKIKVKGSNIRKNDKLKYIDMLTSLKNRNYLNDNIEYWDSSEVYPQTIVIIDLNNIAYINDNYGHQEGDNVIRDAANILIRNQISNTDIIRTNGNEFLIYMVGYDEKQVLTYIKKLNKEFKDLSHGFGAAIGYSMINDAIKTIDDAFNEATLDMRTVKEETNN